MRFARFLVCATVLSTAGCTQYSLSKGQALATAGSTLATQMRDEAGAAADDYRLDSRRSALLSVLGRVKNPDLTISVNPPDVAGYERVADVLETRKAMLNSLVDLYASLKAGMSYNAAGETATAFSAFTSGLDAYQKALDPAAAGVGNSPEVQAAGQITGLLADYVQKRNMVRASQLISRELPVVRKALLDEERLNISVRTTNALLKHRLSDAMLDLGLVDATATLDAAAKLADSARAPDALKTYQSSERLRRGFAAYNLWSDSVFEQLLIEKEYDALIGGIDNLIKQHRRFEAGDPVDLGVLIEDAQKIKSISDTLRGKSNG